MAAILGLKLTGGATNADPNASLGGARSAENLSAVVLNNLFDDVKPQEGTAGATEYRALDLFNAGDAAAAYVTFWVDPNTPSPSTVLEVGGDALESTKAIANETTAPAGVTFAEVTEAARLELPNIPAGQGYRLWLKRTVTAGAENLSEDGVVYNWEYA